MEAVGDHILILLSALDVHQFEGHVLVAYVGALVGQVEFHIVDVALDGEDDEVLPAIGLLVEFNRFCGHIDYKPFGDTFKSIRIY